MPSIIPYYYSLYPTIWISFCLLHHIKMPKQMRPWECVVFLDCIGGFSMQLADLVLFCTLRLVFNVAIVVIVIVLKCGRGEWWCPLIQIVQNINLVIATNKTLVLVGKSGSGKSSILHLILRLYDLSLHSEDQPVQNEGPILFDGLNITDVNDRL